MAKVYSWLISEPKLKGDIFTDAIYSYIVAPNDKNNAYVGPEQYGANLKFISDFASYCSEEEYVVAFERMKNVVEQRGYDVEFEEVNAYMNLNTTCDNLRGPAGRGIKSMELYREGPGKSKWYRFKYDDDNYSEPFEILGGEDGVQGPSGAKGDVGVGTKMLMVYASGKSKEPSTPKCFTYDYINNELIVDEKENTDGWKISDSVEPPVFISNALIYSTDLDEDYKISDIPWTKPVQITGDNGMPGEDGESTEFIYKVIKGTPGTPITVDKYIQLTDNEVKNIEKNARILVLDEYNWGSDNIENNILPRKKIEGYDFIKLNNVLYVWDDSKDEIPNGWKDNPSGVDEDNPEEWMSLRKLVKGIDGKFSTWGDWSEPTLWSKYGVNGQDGDGVQYIYLRNKGTVPANPTPFGYNNRIENYQLYYDTYQDVNNEWIPPYSIMYENLYGDTVEFIPEEDSDGNKNNIWNDDVIDVSADYTHVWMCCRKYRGVENEVNTIKFKKILIDGNYDNISEGEVVYCSSDNSFYVLKSIEKKDSLSGWKKISVKYTSNGNTMITNSIPTQRVLDNKIQYVLVYDGTAESGTYYEWDGLRNEYAESNDYNASKISITWIGDKKWGKYSDPSLWAKFGENGENGENGRPRSIRKIYTLTDSTNIVPSKPTSVVYTNAWGTAFPTDYKFGENVVWACEAEIWSDTLEFVDRYEIASRVLGRNIEYIFYDDKYYKWDDVDNRYEEDPIGTTDINKVISLDYLPNEKLTETSIIRPSGVTDDNTLEINDSLPDEKIDNENIVFVLYNKNYYKWTEGAWTEPYLVTGTKGISSESVDVTVTMYAYAPSIQEPDTPKDTVDSTLDEESGYVVTVNRNDINGNNVEYKVRWKNKITTNERLDESYFDINDGNITQIDGCIDKYGNEWYWYRTTVSVNSIGKTIKGWGVVDRYSQKGDKGDKGDRGNKIERRFGYTPDNVTQEDIKKLWNKGSRNPELRYNNTLCGWYGTESTNPFDDVDTFDLAIWEIYAEIDYNDNLVGEWSDAVRTNGKKGEQGPIGKKGVSGIPGARLKTMYCLGVFSEDITTDTDQYFETTGKTEDDKFVFGNGYFGGKILENDIRNVYDLKEVEWFESSEYPNVNIINTGQLEEGDTIYDYIENNGYNDKKYCGSVFKVLHYNEESKETKYSLHLYNRNGSITRLTDEIDKDTADKFNTYLYVIQGSEFYVKPSVNVKGYYKSVFNVIYSGNTKEIDTLEKANIDNAFKYYKCGDSYYKYDAFSDIADGDNGNGFITINNNDYPLNPTAKEVNDIPSGIKEKEGTIEYDYIYTVSNGKRQYYKWFEFVVTNEDDPDAVLIGYNWDKPFKTQGTNGLKGMDGRKGAIIYPKGQYNSNEVYVCNDKKAPYVYDASDGLYYVYNNTDEVWVGTLPSGKTYLTIIQPNDVFGNYVDIEINGVELCDNHFINSSGNVHYDTIVERMRMENKKYARIQTRCLDTYAGILFKDGKGKENTPVHNLTTGDTLFEKYYEAIRDENGEITKFKLVSKYKYFNYETGEWILSDQDGEVPSKNYANAEEKNGTPAWERFENFEAIYASVAIIENGLFGSAVFNNEFMFSQQGINDNGDIVTDGSYHNFLSAYEYDSVGKDGKHWRYKKEPTKYLSIDEVNPYAKEGNKYIHGFMPNICINFSTGQMWTSCGKITMGSVTNISTTEETNEIIGQLENKTNNFINQQLNISTRAFTNYAIYIRDNFNIDYHYINLFKTKNEPKTTTLITLNYGDIWFDTNNKTVKCYDSSEWKTIDELSNEEHINVLKNISYIFSEQIGAHNKIFIKKPEKDTSIKKNDIWILESDEYKNKTFKGGFTGLTKDICVIFTDEFERLDIIDYSKWGKRDVYLDDVLAKLCDDVISINEWAEDGVLSPQERKELMNKYIIFTGETGTTLNNIKTVLGESVDYKDYSEACASACTAFKEHLYSDDKEITGTDVVQIKDSYSSITEYYKIREEVLTKISIGINTVSSQASTELENMTNDGIISKYELSELKKLLNDYKNEFEYLSGRTDTAINRIEKNGITFETEKNIVDAYGEFYSGYTGITHVIEYYLSSGETADPFTGITIDNNDYSITGSTITYEKGKKKLTEKIDRVIFALTKEEFIDNYNDAITDAIELDSKLTGYTKDNVFSYTERCGLFEEWKEMISDYEKTVEQIEAFLPKDANNKPIDNGYLSDLSGSCKTADSIYYYYVLGANSADENGNDIGYFSVNNYDEYFINKQAVLKYEDENKFKLKSDSLTGITNYYNKRIEILSKINNSLIGDVNTSKYLKETFGDGKTDIYGGLILSKCIAISSDNENEHIVAIINGDITNTAFTTTNVTDFSSYVKCDTTPTDYKESDVNPIELNKKFEGATYLKYGDDYYEWKEVNGKEKNKTIMFASGIVPQNGNTITFHKWNVYNAKKSDNKYNYYVYTLEGFNPKITDDNKNNIFEFENTHTYIPSLTGITTGGIINNQTKFPYIDYEYENNFETGFENFDGTRSTAYRNGNVTDYNFKHELNYNYNLSFEYEFGEVDNVRYYSTGVTTGYTELTYIPYDYNAKTAFKTSSEAKYENIDIQEGYFYINTEGKYMIAGKAVYYLNNPKDATTGNTKNIQFGESIPNVKQTGYKYILMLKEGIYYEWDGVEYKECSNRPYDDGNAIVYYLNEFNSNNNYSANTSYYKYVKNIDNNNETYYQYNDGYSNYIKLSEKPSGATTENTYVISDGKKLPSHRITDYTYVIDSGNTYYKWSDENKYEVTNTPNDATNRNTLKINRFIKDNVRITDYEYVYYEGSYYKWSYNKMYYICFYFNRENINGNKPFIVSFYSDRRSYGNSYDKYISTISSRFNYDASSVSHISIGEMYYDEKDKDNYSDYSIIKGIERKNTGTRDNPFVEELKFIGETKKTIFNKLSPNTSYDRKLKRKNVYENLIDLTETYTINSSTETQQTNLLYNCNYNIDVINGNIITNDFIFEIDQDALEYINGKYGGKDESVSSGDTLTLQTKKLWFQTIDNQKLVSKLQLDIEPIDAYYFNSDQVSGISACTEEYNNEIIILDNEQKKYDPLLFDSLMLHPYNTDRYSLIFEREGKECFFSLEKFYEKYGATSANTVTRNIDKFSLSPFIVYNDGSVKVKDIDLTIGKFDGDIDSYGKFKGELVDATGVFKGSIHNDNITTKEINICSENSGTLTNDIIINNSDVDTGSTKDLKYAVNAVNKSYTNDKIFEDTKISKSFNLCDFKIPEGSSKIEIPKIKLYFKLTNSSTGKAQKPKKINLYVQFYDKNNVLLNRNLDLFKPEKMDLNNYNKKASTYLSGSDSSGWQEIYGGFSGNTISGKTDLNSGTTHSVSSVTRVKIYCEYEFVLNNKMLWGSKSSAIIKFEPNSGIDIDYTDDPPIFHIGKNGIRYIKKNSTTKENDSTSSNRTKFILSPELIEISINGKGIKITPSSFTNTTANTVDIIT